MSTCKLAIVGVGNCASSLLQGLEYYKPSNRNSCGVMHEFIGDYSIADIETVAAFDVNTDKIGEPLSKAVWAEPNCTKKFSEVLSDVIVQKAPLLDGLSSRMLGVIPTVEEVESEYKPLVREYADKLAESGATVLVSYLPVGSKRASIFWAEVCLSAGVAFVNAIPEFICSDVEWSKKFEEAGIPCAGDDIKSQIGATIVHRVLTSLIAERGHKLDGTYQLNIGGNTDFQNMQDEERLVSKRVSKTEAVTSMVDEYDLQAKIGPSDYVPHLKDNKVAYINFKGRQFGDIPFEMDIKLSVEDSPNSAGVMIDAIRMTQVALDRGLSGYQDFSTYFFKHPRDQVKDSEARKIVDDFLSSK